MTMDGEERALFASAIEGAVARGGDLDAALDELGWGEALVEDEPAAVAVLFEAQGRAAATSRALDRLLAHALGAPAGAVIVLPAFGSAAAPGVLRSGRLEVRGLLISAALSDGPVLVPCCREDHVTLVEVGPGALSARATAGLDPALGLSAVEASGIEPGAVAADPVPWASSVVPLAQRALAHELVGASAAMLDLACQHALDRVQFGVPIASFQAVRHKLAETYVAVEGARAALAAAWSEGDPFHAEVAKAIAGRAAKVAAKHGQQVLAGIGFTLEHPFHRSVRRVRVLDGLFGDSRSATHRVGERLLQHGLPEILAL